MFLKIKIILKLSYRLHNGITQKNSAIGAVFFPQNDMLNYK